MRTETRFSGRQITVMVVAVSFAVLGAPALVWAATGSFTSGSATPAVTGTNTSGTYPASGVYGHNTATSGSGIGVLGSAASTGGYGVYSFGRLGIRVGTGQPPIVVSSGAGQATNLNSQYVGGLSAAQLKTTGGVGFTNGEAAIPLNTTMKLVTHTGALPAGTYYAIATATITVATGDAPVDCWVSKGTGTASTTSSASDQSYASTAGAFNATEAIAYTLTAGQDIQEWCVTNGANGSTVFDASVVAIRILSSSGRTPG